MPVVGDIQNSEKVYLKRLHEQAKIFAAPMIRQNMPQQKFFSVTGAMPVAARLAPATMFPAVEKTAQEQTAYCEELVETLVPEVTAETPSTWQKLWSWGKTAYDWFSSSGNTEAVKNTKKRKSKNTNTSRGVWGRY